MNMETLKIKRTLLWVAVILLAANLAFIGWHFLGRSRPHHHERRGPELLFTRLGFDAQQRAAATKMVENHASAIRPVQDSLKQARTELFRLTTEKKSDSLLSAQLEKVSELKRKEDSLTIIHFIALRSLCKPDQMEKFDHFLKRVADGAPSLEPPLKRGHHRRVQ